MRPKGTAAALEARRRYAAALLRDGKSLAETAELVGASLSSVKRWKKAVREGGEEALAAKPHPGPSSQLSNDQKRRLTEILSRGARAAGYRTELWTCKRVAQVIEKTFGVSYHFGHAWRILRSLNWSSQRPERRARERDDAAVEKWRRADWPRIKKGSREQASLVFLDETGFMLQPVVRSTWAPRGQTPIHYSWDRHDRISVIGALTLVPQRRRIGVYFTYQYENIVTENVMFFLRQLHQQVRRNLILICDRWSVHRSAVRRLQQRHAWLQVEWLPPYAPDLNPVEAMWSYTKYSDLANYIPLDVAELENAVLDSLADQHYDKRLKNSFFKTAQLHL